VAIGLGRVAGGDFFEGHPGRFPEEPVHPGKRAHWLLKAWYRFDRYRWRNHDRKQSPWWSHYRRYLNKSAQWKKIRVAVLRRDGYRCQNRGCRNKATEVHHKYYTYVGREWERLSCLTSLCAKCHSLEHSDKAKPRFNALWVRDAAPEPKEWQHGLKRRH
jgi:5-methylcytosine-specific restriction endonuclease McrA